MTPLLFFGLGVSSVFGLEHRNLDNHSVNRKAVEHQEPANIAQVVPKQLAFFELLDRLRVIPQFGQFMAVLCIFTFSMFLNDAVLEPYGAAVFGMNICATTALNALLAVGFFVGLGLSGFRLVDWIGNINTARLGAVFASIALAFMLLSAPLQSLVLLHFALTFFGISLGICIHASFTLMFAFVESGRVGLLLGVWGAMYSYSRGFATISGGGLLTLFKNSNGGNVYDVYGGIFCLQILGFLTAAVLMGRLDVNGFRRSVQSRFGDFMQSALD